MAAPFFNTPFQPYVYQSPEDAFIPFQILGGEAQIVQIMLKPEEKVTARPGSICYMSGSMEMENVYQPENEAGLLQWLFGKSITSVVVRNSGQTDGFVGIAAPSLARILPPDAFLCSVSSVKVSNAVNQRIRNIPDGVEVRLRNIPGVQGFLRQKLSGTGLAFIVAGGSAVQKNLEVGEILAVDVSCIAAVSSTVDVKIQHNAPMRRAVFGGENQVTALLKGPGIVFIQSLPFTRFSQRIARSVASPNMREHPKFLLQLALFFFLAYVAIISSLILTEGG
ncbi:unnamed protein product [Rhodiola kirilowii]